VYFNRYREFESHRLRHYKSPRFAGVFVMAEAVDARELTEFDEMRIAFQASAARPKAKNMPKHVFAISPSLK
jgi:hypothetical protein